MNNRVQTLYELGQSIWYDQLSRQMIDSGELQRLIDLGVVGVTSNPTILMKAITGSSRYDAFLGELVDAGKNTQEVYEGLVVPDIADAADLLRPVYDRTNGVDGYVSLEVSPKIAYDTEATIQEARSLFARLDRPNVLIKVPATEEGIPAVATLIGEGINVNITLIFSIAMYRKVMQAYLDGLAVLDKSGGNLSKVASVASFFVSRVDTLVDQQLREKREAGADVDHLLGRTAIANARLAYACFEEVFGKTGAFGELAGNSARVQRPLWASTSTKNPNDPDTMYVDQLVGPHTVNTLPPKTLDAVLDHGQTTVTLTKNLDEARSTLADIDRLGIDLQAVTDRLTVDGVNLFSKSFDDLLADLSQKRAQLRPVG